MNMREDQRDSRWTLANALSGFRLFIAAPLMLVAAALEARELFTWVLVVSFCSDAIDGTVARLTGQETRFGAMLDSWADAAAYTAIAIGVAVLWPGLVRDEWPAFAIIVASFATPSLAGLVKFGQFTSYHTRLVKAAVAAVAAALLLLLWDGPSWPFRIAALIALLAALEELAITCVIDQPRSNVSSLVAVWRARRPMSR